MFKTIAWNQISIIDGNEVGKMVISTEIEAANVTEAMDQMQVMASDWNKEADKDMQVNFITCKGFIRNA